MKLRNLKKLMSYLFLAAMAPFAAFADNVYVSDVLDIATAKQLFTHELKEITEGEFVIHTSKYDSPDGKVAVVEETFYLKDQLFKINFYQHQTNEQGSLKIDGDKLTFKYLKDGKEDVVERSKKPSQRLVYTDGIVSLILEKWDALNKGDSVEFILPILDRKDYYTFSLAKESEVQFKDHPAVIFKMNLKNPLLRVFSGGPLHFTFDRGSKEFLQLQGRTMPKIQSGKSWDDLSAMTVPKNPEAVKERVKEETTKVKKKSSEKMPKETGK